MQKIIYLSIGPVLITMDISMSSYGSKSRREMFEEQLKELQRDISNLSHKLSVPSLVTTNRVNSIKNSTAGSESVSKAVLNDNSQGIHRSFEPSKVFFPAQ